MIVISDPQEAHPPVYYADYRCDSANDSLSNRFPITESSSAVLSNNEEDSNADDRTVGSSNSLGSLTTVENFETEDAAHCLHPGHGKWCKWFCVILFEMLFNVTKMNFSNYITDRGKLQK